ncbi:phosphoenolpyruvate--protein phosphotransferase [bacterium]|nr:phosphoenolpyruvate--protein phosphotransferase [bacterium]
MRLKEQKIASEVISPGMVSGRLLVVEHKAPDYPKHWLCDSDIEPEKKRFLKAVRECRTQSEQMSHQVSHLESSAVVSAHSLLFEDDLLVNNTLREIENFSINAEWALSRTVSEIRDVFLTLPQGYIRERIHDINFIESSILLKLLKKKPALSQLSPQSRLLAMAHPSPEDIVSLNRQHALGVLTSAVGYNSHTAIMARSLGLPLFNLHAAVLNKLPNNVFVVLDGHKSQVVVNPTAKKMSLYRRAKRQHDTANQKLMRDARKNSVTADGVTVHLLGNVEFDEETRMVERLGGSGIGLFRTEFLFGTGEGDGDEETQYRYYCKLLGHPHLGEITLRTLDMGGDKIFENSPLGDEPNPALGMRAIRLYTKYKNLFEMQVRAILRAYNGKQKLKICFPMVTSAAEFKKLKKDFWQIAEKLKKTRFLAEKNIVLGAMLEVPSLVYEMDFLSREADFISVGSNDLIQYFLAVDRTNENVAYLYNPYHPSIIRVLREIVKKAEEHDLEVTFCGEIATEPRYLFLLLILGYRRFSMYPMAIPRIKNTIRSLNIREDRFLYDKISHFASQNDVEDFLEKTYRQAWA